jgi:hypothetical protein
MVEEREAFEICGGEKSRMSNNSRMERSSIFNESNMNVSNMDTSKYLNENKNFNNRKFTNIPSTHTKKQEKGGRCINIEELDGIMRYQ